VIHFLGRILEAGSNILRLQIRKVSEDFASRHAAGQEIKHVLHPDARAPETRASTALPGIERDSMLEFPGGKADGLLDFSESLLRQAEFRLQV